MAKSPCLKETMSGASAMTGGSELHVMIVPGKKLLL